MNKVIETIKERSSTRGYTAEPLTQEELNILLHAGLQAPTAANRQEIHFTVLSGSHPILQDYKSAPQFLLRSSHCSRHQRGQHL